MFLLLTKSIKKQLTEVSYNSVFARKVGPTFLLLIQKITIRAITSSTNRVHCKPLFVNQGIIHFYYQVILYCVVHVKGNQLYCDNRRGTEHISRTPFLLSAA